MKKTLLVLLTLSCLVTVNAKNPILKSEKATVSKSGFKKLPPTAPDQTYVIAQPAANSFITLNGTGAPNDPGPLTATDPEDGTVGTGAIFNLIVNVNLNGNKLFYNGVEVVGAIGIDPYIPALLEVQFTGTGSNTLSFIYQAFDSDLEGSNFANYTISWFAPLPAKKFDLSVGLAGTVSNISWLTENETNSSRFFAERSTDARNFTSVGDVAAAGNTAGFKSYSLQDNLTAVVNVPVLYYRIKLVDTDGKINYSNTVAVRLSNVKSIKTWPNPVTENLVVSLYSNLSTKLELRIVDITGKTVVMSNYAVVKGNNQINVKGLEVLSTGIYVLDLKDKAGNINHVQKLIKE
jgi:Secretion system C-terminal sorting domain